MVDVSSGVPDPGSWTRDMATRTHAFSGKTVRATVSKSCMLRTVSSGGRASSSACRRRSSSVTSFTALTSVLWSMSPSLIQAELTGGYVTESEHGRLTAFPGVGSW